MQTRKTATPTRQPVKTATRSATPTRKAAPAKAVVRAAAPAKKIVASRQPVKAASRQLVKTTIPECMPQTPDDEPCDLPPPRITFPCDREKRLTCIILADNVNLETWEVIIADPAVPLDAAFPTVEEVAECAQSTSTDECANQFTAVIEYTTTVTLDSVYSVTRVYRVTDNCDPSNSALFTFTIYFTVSDGTGPNITISPPVGSVGLPQCSEGTNPNPECECVFLPGCKPSRATILAALGTAEADGCRPTVTYSDVGPFNEGEEGCYKYMIRTFTAKDECCNESTKCRVVRWLNDITNPTIEVSPTIAQILARVPGAVECDDTPEDTEEIAYECIDLGCNPTVDILVLLGTGKAIDNCGPAQLCTKTKRRVGDCCYFSQTRTFTATDPCGNTAVKIVRTIRWKVDYEAPVIQCASDKVVPCGTSVEDASLLFDTPDAFDNCDGCIEAENYKADTIVRDRNGTVTITRYWSATDSCGNTGYGEQTITIDCSTEDCDTTQKGCSRGFWGNPNGVQKWDQISSEVADSVLVTLDASGYGFSQTTPFLSYFGFIKNITICGISPTLTMLDAINLGGGGCNQLAAQGVAALLNMAAFGSEYIIPAPYSSINTIEELYLAIQAALETCDCTALAAALASANVHEEGGVCLAIPQANQEAPAVVPKKLALKRGLKTAPAKKAIKPTLKKAVAPAPKKLARKTFTPGNAQ